MLNLKKLVGSDGYPWPKTFDPYTWASEFTRNILGNEIQIDHSLMARWFANAIMAGYDKAHRDHEQLSQELVNSDNKLIQVNPNIFHMGLYPDSISVYVYALGVLNKTINHPNPIVLMELIEFLDFWDSDIEDSIRQLGELDILDIEIDAVYTDDGILDPDATVITFKEALPESRWKKP